MTKLLIKRFIKDYENTQNSDVRTAYGKFSSIVGIVCNAILFISKLIVGTLSASVSITADAVNNLSDASSSIISLLGFKLASRPADEEHPYGHGRYEYLSGLMVAVLIMVIGVELFKSSLDKVLHPSAVEFSWVTVGVLAFSILLKTWMALFNTKTGKMIYPKTIGQAILCDAMRHNEIVFATGVAGTGKTYLAVAYAVSMLKSERVEKIILTRPAVEAGESLGFLPGDMKEKVDPYLRPLYDALNEMLGLETVEKYVEKQVIEIAPLAFMRGRTLNDAVVILDEAQNATCAQMKMFLTRMGKNCKMVVTGDVTQIDLIKKKDSGLMQACTILDHIDGISIIHLENSDVVRNPLVQKIIERYAKVE